MNMSQVADAFRHAAILFLKILAVLLKRFHSHTKAPLVNVFGAFDRKSD
jgi:hypothetical protein